MPQLTIGETDFLMDGRPYRIISGALHYFRVRPEHWADRIRKARLMGLNTIETYVAWNYHAPRADVFDLDGDRDLGRFLDLVAAEGMNAIVRPGPYICAEWVNGGLPVWLTAEPGLRLRSSDQRYLAAVEDYLRKLAPVLVPRQAGRGGPIILMQVENEYGAYGSDTAYLTALTALYRELGIDVPLTTVDQPVDEMLANGGLSGVHRTGSFGSQIDERLDILRLHQPTGPLMCSEFWDGWFDSWGLYHHETSGAAAAADLERLLARGASVNIYMFHGGTNFGVSNGANDKGIYDPIATSYDYDAPLAEDGTPTEKYWAFREVIARYAPVPEERPDGRQPTPSFEVGFERAADWRSSWRRPGTRSERPLSFDELEAEGFVLYRRRIEGTGRGVLAFRELRDRAQVFFEGVALGTADRNAGDRIVALPAHRAGLLEILVEDQGRVDYGPRLGEWKGVGGVSLDGEELLGWESVDVLPGTAVPELCGSEQRVPAGPVAGPVVLSARLDLDRLSDLHLSTDGWGKGLVWVNGFALGRYWSRGPQRTLYVPEPVLRPGENELVVLELNGMADPTVRFVSGPELGPVDR